MDEVVLSICISSFNRGEKCVQLVQRILAVEDDRYNIFICDDCSDEDTVRKLQILQSQKVKLVQNRVNVGPCINWYKTINCGDGQYILHILDRDDIKIRSITDILDILETHVVGAGYIGQSFMSIDRDRIRGKKFVVCREGREAFITMAGVPVHPTGFLVNREQWGKGEYKKFFSQNEKYGIYPHSYVLGKVAVQNDMLYMPITFCSYCYVGTNKKSRFYEKSQNKNYWWLPNNAIEAANRLVLYLCRIADNTYKEDFLCKRFQEGLYRVTMGYKLTVSNKAEMGRYNMPVRNVTKGELAAVSLKYYLVFYFVWNKAGGNASGRKKIKKIWIENLTEIIRT